MDEPLLTDFIQHNVIFLDDLMSEILEEKSQDMVDLFAKEVNKYNLR